MFLNPWAEALAIGLGMLILYFCILEFDQVHWFRTKKNKSIFEVIRFIAAKANYYNTSLSDTF